MRHGESHGAQTIFKTLLSDLHQGQLFSFVSPQAGDGMKKDWFAHTDLTTEEADELVARYREKGVKVEKCLAADPRLWIVSAYLPQQKSHPTTGRSLRSRAWSRS
jgi:hypothetical protein